MLSQFFILSARGDTLIVRDYRKDLSKTTPESFYRYVKEKGVMTKPCFVQEGINYSFLERNTLYVVGTSRFNNSPALMLEILIKICKIIKDLCGDLTEDTVRKNFVLIYEILDEALDYGFPQILESQKVSEFVQSKPTEIIDKSKLSRNVLGVIPRSTMTSDATKVGIDKMDNQIFVDVIEKVTAIFGSSDNIVSSFVDGTVVCKSYVPGNPIFKLLFCENLSIGEFQNYGIKLSSANFSQCVDYSQFENNKSLTFTPPAGTSDIMYYKITKDFNYPFKVHVFLSEISTYKVQLEIKVLVQLILD